MVLRLTEGRTPWVPLGTTAQLLTFAFFLDCSLCDITQRKMVVSHRRFGTTNRFPLQGSNSQKRMHSSWTAHSGILCSVKWWLVTDVSGQPIGSRYKVRTVKKECIILGLLTLGYYAV